MRWVQYELLCKMANGKVENKIPSMVSLSVHVFGETLQSRQVTRGEEKSKSESSSLKRKVGRVFCSLSLELQEQNEKPATRRC